MTDRQFKMLMMVAGNCFLFGLFGFAVFVLHFSGWWFVYPTLIHFTNSDFKEDEENV